MFYATGLGLTVLARFTDHAGFDGIILGHRTAPWHLEFTHHPDHPPGPPHPEALLVPDLSDDADWRAACDRLSEAGAEAVTPTNPYWAARGRSFADPEGNRIVLQNADWTL